ncbi:hypothetical protein [Myroides sp. LJL110]
MKKIKRPLEPIFALAYAATWVARLIMGRSTWFLVTLQYVFLIAVFVVYFYYNYKQKKQNQQDHL